ncbi:MAG: MMPL family transporter, partial [Thermomicrobiales bacterium]
MASTPKARSGPLRRWAKFATHNPWKVLGGWLVVIVILAGLAASMGGSFVDNFTVPGAESQQALDTLQDQFPVAAGDSAQVVFKSDAGIADPATTEKITTFVTEAAALPEVIAVISPFDGGTISPDGTIAYATVQYAVAGVELDVSSVDALLHLVEESSVDGFQTEVGGQVVQEVPEPGSSEILGIIAAIVILLIMFGSIIAMGLPIVTAIIGVGTSILITTILASFIDLSSITTALLTMMGLGVGIDYSLFIITRFREERAAGRSIEQAAITATDTSGRAVLFAGTVVVVALLGLFVIGIPFIGLLGFGGAVAVVLSMAIAVGMMPSLLALLGGAMDRWAFVPNRHRPTEKTFGSKLTTLIQKAPALWFVGGLIILGALAAPAILNAQLGSADAGTNAADTTTRKAYDLVAEGFGPGTNGPLLVVVESDNALDPAAIDTLTAAISGTENVAFVSPPNYNESSNTAVLQAIPITAPQDEATLDL